MSSIYNIVLSIMAKGTQIGEIIMRPYFLSLVQLYLFFAPRAFVLNSVSLTINNCGQGTIFFSPQVLSSNIFSRSIY